MADTTDNRDHRDVVNGAATYLTDFPERVRRGWFKSVEPNAILTCESLPDVYVYVNGGVNCRIVGKRGVYEWRFTITATGDKQLRNVALISDDYRGNFILKSVQENGSEIGATNGQEWHNPRASYIVDRSIKRHYSITIAFAASKYGTYRQNVIFGFKCSSTFLQRICADYLPIQDYARIQTATNYQLSQIPSRWPDPYAFYSPFMQNHADLREIKLSKIYPYPDKQNFFLTQDTLSDNRLTPQNYRGRMHEMITVEEIARHEQLSRYNQISWLRLMSQYVLSNCDGSTIAKYTPPGELFAQVRFFPCHLDITLFFFRERMFLYY